MATRNHTPTFRSVRANIDARLQHRSGGKMPILSRPSKISGSAADFHRLGDGDNDVESAVVPMEPLAGTALPPQWVDVVDEVNALFREIETKLERLAEAHKARVMVHFDEAADAHRDAEIAQLSKAITKKMHEADERIRAVGRNPQGEQDAKVRRNVQVTLATRLQDYSMTFRKAQKTYMSRMKHLTPAKHELETGGISVDDDPLSRRQVSTQEMAALEDAEAMVRHREEEIIKIAKNIEELSTLFKELAVLVIEQGTLLDRIDYNMDLVVERVQKGVVELEIADKYSKSNRANYCLAILVVLIVIFLGLLVAKLRH